MSAGIGLVAYGLIEHTVAAGLAGAAALAAFLAVERSRSHPMLPLSLFASRQFSGANLTTVAVYGAMSAALFLVTLRLQVTLGYSALEAGASMLPFTGLMLALSARVGSVAQRIGPRLPMTVGPLLSAAGLLLFSSIGPGDRYVTAALPAVALFGLGMTVTVAPLTAAVLGAVDRRRAGVASAVNNVAARLAGVLGIAVIPVVAGIDTGGGVARSLDTGYPTALRISAALCAVGAGRRMAVCAVVGICPVHHPSRPAATPATMPASRSLHKETASVPADEDAVRSPRRPGRLSVHPPPAGAVLRDRRDGRGPPRRPISPTWRRPGSSISGLSAGPTTGSGRTAWSSRWWRRRCSTGGRCVSTTSSTSA